ncbi:MAG TPA: amino acid permease [Terriglobia bacterium]|nr:amino acid permease [Terriglobia bacterium]
MATPLTAQSTATTKSTELVKGLGLFDSTTLVIGSMIGSGVFIVAAEIARQVKSPGLLLLSWIVSGLITVMAAVTYGELAAMMPHAGGQYVYLREALSPLFGFLYGWTLFLVIQTGTIAAVAVAFGKFLGVFVPWISAENILVNLGSVRAPLWGHAIALTLSSQQFVAILCLMLLATINIFGLRTGAWVQNVFTVLKVGALLGIVGLGAWWVAGGHTAATSAANAPPSSGFWGGAHWDLATLTIISVALVGPLFSSDAWNNITFTGAEVVNPKRNLPLALFTGTLIVCSLYFACNWVYFRVLPFYGDPHGIGPLARGIQYAAEDRVATAAMQVIFGPRGESLMAAAIIVSTFGCINGLSLAGARVYYAMSKDGLFFSSVSKLNRKYHTPAVSLMVQGAWACFLTLTGTYNELLDYVIFAVMLFYILTILGLFRLRRTRPDAPRPYRAWGYPVVPGLYVACALFIEWALLTHKALRSVAGLCIVALGVPVYYLWRRGAAARKVQS